MDRGVSYLFRLMSASWVFFESSFGRLDRKDKSEEIDFKDVEEAQGRFFDSSYEDLEAL